MTQRTKGLPLAWFAKLILGVRQDLYIRLALVSAGLSAAFHAGLARMPPEWTTAATRTDAVMPAVLFLLVPVACLGGLRTLAANERRFWLGMAAALGCWWLVLVEHAIASFRAPAFALNPLDEVLFGTFFLLMVVTVARQPHAGPRLPTRLGWLVIWPTAVVFVGSLVAYFILLPRFLAPDAHDPALASQCLFAVLDAYLTGQLALLSGATGPVRWRAIYLLLAIMTGTWWLHDSIHAYQLYRGLTPGGGGLAMAVWFLAAMLAARIARARTIGPGASRSQHATVTAHQGAPAVALMLELEARDPRAAWHTLGAAIVLPMIHILFSWLAIFPDRLRAAQESLLLLAILALGAIASLQHNMLRRAVGTLRRTRAQTEDAVRRYRTDRQLQRERTRAQEAVRTVEDRFAAVFRACPAAMLITRLEDGRIVDLNQSFEALTGLTRHACLGCTTESLGIRPSGVDQPAFVRRVRDGETLRGMPVALSVGERALRSFQLDATRIELEDGPGMLLLARPVPGSRDPSPRKDRDSAWFGLDARHRLRSLSAVLGAAIGSDTATMLGKPATAALGIDGEALETLLEASGARGVACGTLRFTGTHGAPRKLEARCLAVTDQHGDRSALVTLTTPKSTAGGAHDD